MSSSVIEVGQILLAVLVFGYIFYVLAFSGREAQRREAAEQIHRGFERRDAERVERRVNEPIPPPGQEDRRRAEGRRAADA